MAGVFLECVHNEFAAGRNPKNNPLLNLIACLFSEKLTLADNVSDRALFDEVFGEGNIKRNNGLVLAFSGNDAVLGLCHNGED